MIKKILTLEIAISKLRAIYYYFANPYFILLEFFNRLDIPRYFLICYFYTTQFFNDKYKY